MKIHAFTVVKLVRKGQYSGDHRELWPYYDFLHGECEPLPRNVYGTKPYSPAKLTHNVQLLPPAMLPEDRLFKNADVAVELSKLPGIDLAPAVWCRAYSHPVDRWHIEDLYRRFSTFDSDPFKEWLEEIGTEPDDALRRVRYHYSAGWQSLFSL